MTNPNQPNNPFFQNYNKPVKAQGTFLDDLFTAPIWQDVGAVAGLGENAGRWLYNNAIAAPTYYGFGADISAPYVDTFMTPQPSPTAPMADPVVPNGGLPSAPTTQEQLMGMFEAIPPAADPYTVNLGGGMPMPSFPEFQAPQPLQVPQGLFEQATHVTDPTALLESLAGMAPPNYQAFLEALQANGPQELSPDQQNELLRSNVFAGLGAAAQNVDPRLGAGHILLQLGGGALSGLASGQQQVQQKREAYETALREHQMLVAQTALGAEEASYERRRADLILGHEIRTQADASARDAAATAFDMLAAQNASQNQAINAQNANLAAAMEYNWRVFQATQPSISHQGGNIIIQSRDPVTGDTVAEIIDDGSNAQKYQGMVFKGLIDSIVAGDTRGLSEIISDSGFQVDPVSQAAMGLIVGQNVQNLLGEEASQTLFEEVQTSLTSQGITPGTSSYNDMVNNAMLSRLIAVMKMNPDLFQYATQLNQQSGL